MSTNSWIAGFYDKKVVNTCRVCGKETEKEYQLVQPKFSMFGLTLFPLSRKVYWICKGCYVTKELKSGASISLDNFEQDIKEELLISFKSQYHIRNYWGSIVILCLILSVVTLVLVYA